MKGAIVGAHVSINWNNRAQPGEREREGGREGEREKGTDGEGAVKEHHPSVYDSSV